VTPEKIARELSPAMRKALLLGEPPKIRYAPTWFALHDRGLIYANKVTDLGRAVIAILRAQG
jgi:hypothetical protein